MATLLEQTLEELRLTPLQARVVIEASEVQDGVLVYVRKPGLTEDQRFPRKKNFYFAADEMAPDVWEGYGPQHLVRMQELRYQGAGDAREEYRVFITPRGRAVAERIQVCMEQEAMDNGNGDDSLEEVA